MCVGRADARRWGGGRTVWRLATGTLRALVLLAVAVAAALPARSRRTPANPVARRRMRVPLLLLLPLVVCFVMAVCRLCDFCRERLGGWVSWGSVRGFDSSESRFGRPWLAALGAIKGGRGQRFCSRAVGAS